MAYPFKCEMELASCYKCNVTPDADGGLVLIVKPDKEWKDQVVIQIGYHPGGALEILGSIIVRADDLIRAIHNAKNCHR